MAKLQFPKTQTILAGNPIDPCNVSVGVKKNKENQQKERFRIEKQETPIQTMDIMTIKRTPPGTKPNTDFPLCGLHVYV